MVDSTTTFTTRTVSADFVFSPPLPLCSNTAPYHPHCPRCKWEILPLVCVIRVLVISQKTSGCEVANMAFHLHLKR